MKVDEETRYIMVTKLNLTDEEINKYERGMLSLSHRDESIIGSTKKLRKIGKELSDVSPLLDKCDVFSANKLLFTIAHKIGEEYSQKHLMFEDHQELMTKLDEYNIAGKMICECKNKVPRTWKKQGT